MYSTVELACVDAQRGTEENCSLIRRTVNLRKYLDCMWT